MPEVVMEAAPERAPETPTQQIIRAASAEREVKVAGHEPAEGQMPVMTLHWRALRTLERMDLNSLAGAQNAMNQAWMADATMAFSVTRINGDPVRKPANLAELRVQIGRIGEEGMAAVAADIFAVYAPEAMAGGDGMDRAKN